MIVNYTALVKDTNDPEGKEVERSFCFRHAFQRGGTTNINSVVVDGPPLCYDCNREAQQKAKPR